MDKVSVSDKDFEKILEWLNKHDKVCLNVDEIPLKAFKLVCDRYVAKFIQDGTVLNISLRFENKPILTSKAFLTPFDISNKCLSSPWIANVEPSSLVNKNRLDELKQLAQSIAKQYIAVMTFMAYGKDDHKAEYEISAQTTPQPSFQNRNKGKRKHKSNGITYVFQKRQGVGEGGHHASPKGEFSVRGHHRHYKCGKVIWIAQFKKGSGKHKDKHYKFKRSDSVGN